MYKKIILNYLKAYLELKKIKMKKTGTIISLVCPFCGREDLTANIIPNTSTIHAFCCKRKYDLIDIARKLDNLEDKKDEEVLQYLKELLDIKVITKKDEDELEKHLDFYVKNGFSLVPIVANKKFPPIEKGWTEKEHKNKNEVKQWIANGLNIGLRTGRVSGVTILDIDQKPIPEEIKAIIGDTLVQESTNGFHLVYKYDSELPKTRIDKFKIDLENDGGYVVFYPSKINGIQRKIEELKPIITMPEKLKKLLLSNIVASSKTNSEKITEAIETENFKINPKVLQLKNDNLDGSCNTEFVKLGGVLRKRLNNQQTSYVLHTLNNHLLESPMDKKVITSMVNELNRYSSADENELIHKILTYLKEVKISTKSDLELAVTGEWTKGETKKQLNRLLRNLVTDGKIILRGRNIEIIEEMQWSDELINVGVPIDFEVPYLHDHSYFNWNDLVIIASKTKYGKTTLSMNMVRRLVQQGIKPYYLYSETGGRFSKTALHLGMKDGDFFHSFITDPRKLILPKKERSVIIFDWIRPPDFATVDNLFAELAEKIKASDGFLISFMQLKANNEYFAPNLLAQYPALVCKYVYEAEDDGLYTKFQITELRDGKIKGKVFDVPCKYDWHTKEVNTIEELPEGKR